MGPCGKTTERWTPQGILHLTWTQQRNYLEKENNRTAIAGPHKPDP